MRRPWLIIAAVILLGVSSCASPSTAASVKRTAFRTPPPLTTSSTSVPNALLPVPPAPPARYGIPCAPGWSEDFNGVAGTAPDPALLGYRLGGNGWGNNELQSYTDRPQNASQDGTGNLLIHAIREPYTGKDGITRQWTSSRLDSLGKWAFTTGTLAVRMKLPGQLGLWPAFWLEGTSVTTIGWPSAGEIDVLEAISNHGDVYHTVHGPDGTANGYAYSANTPAPPGTSMAAAWHVFSIERSPGRLVFAIDGRITAIITSATLKKTETWVFDDPMFMVLNLAVGGWSGMPTEKTPVNSALQIDWIRYYPEATTP